MPPIPRCPKEILDQFNNDLLQGIDKTDYEKDGWWETNEGAEFGANQKEQTLRWLRSALASIVAYAAENGLPNQKPICRYQKPICLYPKSCGDAKVFNQCITDSKSSLLKLAEEIEKGE